MQDTPINTAGTDSIELIPSDGLPLETLKAIHKGITDCFAQNCPGPTAIEVGYPERWQAGTLVESLFGVPIKWTSYFPPGAWHFQHELTVEWTDDEPESILDLAQTRVVEAPDDYGPPGENADNTAAMWNAYIERLTGTNPYLKGRDVGLMMVLLKVSREANRPKRDNLVDIAGWAAVADAASGEAE